MRAARRQTSDEELVRACRQGDSDSFAELVGRYKDRIYNLAYRMFGNREEAEDIAQETFLHIYRSLDSFRTEERFSPWIYRIATNLCLDRLRKMKHSVASLDAPVGPEGDIPQQVADWSHAPEKIYEISEMRADTQQAINDLPPKYKVVVILRHLQDLSYDEIAKAMDIPQGTVKTRLFRAREILRRRLGKLYPVAGSTEERAAK